MNAVIYQNKLDLSCFIASSGAHVTRYRSRRHNCCTCRSCCRYGSEATSHVFDSSTSTPSLSPSRQLPSAPRCIAAGQLLRRHCCRRLLEARRNRRHPTFVRCWRRRRARTRSRCLCRRSLRRSLLRPESGSDRCRLIGEVAVFKHRYPKSYSNINLCWDERRRRREASKTMCPGKKNYIPFCRLCILCHSTMLYFLVVKSFIVASDGQLRITIIILRTSHYFLQKFVIFQLYLGTSRPRPQWTLC